MIDKITYYHLKDIIIIFSIFMYFRNKVNPRYYKKLFNFIYTYTFLFIISFGIILLYGLYNYPSFYEFIGFNWRYYSFYQWGFYIILSLIFTKLITNNVPTSVTYTIQSCSLGGWLYELPSFLRNGNLGVFTYYNINIQILSLPIILIILKNNNYKTTKTFILAFTIYVLSSTLFFLFPNTYSASIRRIPTITLLLSLIGGLQYEI